MVRIPASPSSPSGRNLARHEGLQQVTEILRCKWTIAILDRVAGGINRPGRLERSLPGLTTKVLNERVKKLEGLGVLRRRSYPEVPPRVEYELTDRGRELVDLVETIVEFADDWDPEPAGV
ncbi:MAG: transcriptional regulator [Gemmatimonas sp.]|nr:transcriptional regulator [Gemmatimonas sp.]